jgi:hypothetical protein
MHHTGHLRASNSAARPGGKATALANGSFSLVMHRSKANSVRVRLAVSSTPLAQDGVGGAKFHLAPCAFNAVERSPAVSSLSATKAGVAFADLTRQNRPDAILAEHHYSSSRSLFTAA